MITFQNQKAEIITFEAYTLSGIVSKIETFSKGRNILQISIAETTVIGNPGGNDSVSCMLANMHCNSTTTVRAIVIYNDIDKD